MRVFLGLALAAAVVASGVYSVSRSLGTRSTEGTYVASTTGSASRLDRADGITIGFDE